MLSLYEEYRVACKTETDINEHLEWLYKLASEREIQSIIEFGTGPGRSTRAFLAALEQKPNNTFHSYDIIIQPDIEELFDVAWVQGVNAHFHNSSTLLANFQEVDLLFIDSRHTYDHIKQELLLHGSKAKKYILFHDVMLYGECGQDNGLGISSAIEEFLECDKYWYKKELRENNNGMLLLAKK